MMGVANIQGAFVASLGLSLLMLLLSLGLTVVIGAATVSLASNLVVKFRPAFQDAITAMAFSVAFTVIGAVITSLLFSLLLPFLFEIAGGALVAAILLAQSLFLGASCFRDPLKAPDGIEISFVQGLLLFVLASVAAAISVSIISTLLNLFL